MLLKLLDFSYKVVNINFLYCQYTLYFVKISENNLHLKHNTNYFEKVFHVGHANIDKSLVKMKGKRKTSDDNLN